MFSEPVPVPIPLCSQHPLIVSEYMTHCIVTIRTFPPIFPIDRAELAFSLFSLLRQSLEIADAQNIDESMIQWMTEMWNRLLDIQVWKLKADTELGATSSVLTKPWGQSENLPCEKRVGWGNPENIGLREGQEKKEFTREHEKGKLERLVESHEGS